MDEQRKEGEKLPGGEPEQGRKTMKNGSGSNSSSKELSTSAGSPGGFDRRRSGSPPDAMDLVQSVPARRRDLMTTNSSTHHEPSHLTQVLRQHKLLTAPPTMPYQNHGGQHLQQPASAPPLMGHSHHQQRRPSIGENKIVVLERRNDGQTLPKVAKVPPIPHTDSSRPSKSPGVTEKPNKNPDEKSAIQTPPADAAEPEKPKLSAEEINRRRINAVSEYYRKQREEAQQKEEQRVREQERRLQEQEKQRQLLLRRQAEAIRMREIRQQEMQQQELLAAPQQQQQQLNHSPPAQVGYPPPRTMSYDQDGSPGEAPGHSYTYADTGNSNQIYDF